MGSDQYSGSAYGYGYWNEYGVPSQLDRETCDSIANTSYQVFPQENRNMPFTMGNMPPEDYASMLWEKHTVRTGGSNERFSYSSKSTEDDPEIRTLMEFLENLYFESHDLFKKVFSELLDKYKMKKGNKEEHENAKAFRKLLKKLAMRLFKKKLGEMKVQKMRRSLSLGSPRPLEKFKSKPLDLGGGVDIQQDDQGTTKSHYY